MIHGYCQNRGCKQPVAVEVNSGVEVLLNKETGETGKRTLHLCAGDAAYFLSLRDAEKPLTDKIVAWVNGCHKD